MWYVFSLLEFWFFANTTSGRRHLCEFLCAYKGDLVTEVVGTRCPEPTPSPWRPSVHRLLGGRIMVQPVKDPHEGPKSKRRESFVPPPPHFGNEPDPRSMHRRIKRGNTSCLWFFLRVHTDVGTFTLYSVSQKPPLLSGVLPLYRSTFFYETLKVVYHCEKD